jgi:two-component system LytT family response regulator
MYWDDAGAWIVRSNTVSSFPQDSWVANAVVVADQGAPIRVLVAEPDTVSRRLICSILESECDATILCVDSSRLIPSIQDFEPDLVILDINTTEISRTSAWEDLGMKSSAAAIITGYDATFLNRFSFLAANLLVKPFGVEQLQIALDAARLKIIRGRTELAASETSSNQQHSAEPPQFLNRVAVESGETIALINVKDILWLQSFGNHIRLHVGTATHLVRQTMKSFQRMLDPRHFLRVHRNAIVNLDHVHEFFLPPEGNMYVKLDNETRLPLRRANRALLRKTLKGQFLA